MIHRWSLIFKFKILNLKFKSGTLDWFIIASMNSTTNPSPDQPPAPINAIGCAAIITAMLVAVAIGVYSNSPQLSTAINIVLVVVVLALGMKYGFAWVTAAAQKDPDSPTVVATRPDALQAAPLISKLQQKGIKAIATGTHTAGFQVEIASEVKVVVSKRDAAQALEILGDEAKG